MTLRHSERFPLGTEIICKYFTATKDLRYGDMQTARPATLWDGPPGEYRTTSENGFVNITFEERFLINRIAKQAKGVLPKYPEPEDTGAAYRIYVFSNYLHEIWKIDQQLEIKIPSDFFESGLRRLFAMAYFLMELTKENSPQECGPFLKLYEIFSKDLYDFLSAGTLRDASPAVKCLTAAALRLRAFPEA